jgi:Protein of unknown function (DUF3037)
MKHRETYSYTVLRYVHDVMTGEFVNVGVVVHAASGLMSKFRSTHGRVSKIFPGLDEKAFKEALRAINLAIENLQRDEETAGFFKSSPDAAAFARKALVADDSSFQWSSPGSGISSDISATLHQLYERFVTRYEKHDAQRRDDGDVWKPIRAKLEELNVADKFQQRTFRGTDDEITLEHAWKNGKWHAIQAVSFDLADADGVKTKAHRIRGHLDSVAEGMDDDLALNIVLGQPENPDLMEAYKSACKILEKAVIRPTIVEEDGASDLVARLVDEIHAHQASSTI